MADTRTRHDVYRTITERIIAGIEAGAGDIDADADAIQIRTKLQNDPEGLKADVWLSAAEFRADHPLT